MEEQAFYDPVNFTYPGGAHIAEVEIDPGVRLGRSAVLCRGRRHRHRDQPDDRRGQLHGGIAQGVGQALFENCVYDETSGQMLSGSFMDYCMPRADNMPNMEIVDPLDAVHAYQLRRQRLRRSRHHRVAGDRDQRRGRCAVASRRQSCRHAGNAKPDLAHHPQQRQSAARSGIGAGDEGLFILQAIDGVRSGRAAGGERREPARFPAA